MKNNKKAFTIIELLISIIFLGTLLSLAAINYTHYMSFKLNSLDKSINNERYIYKNISMDYDNYQNLSVSDTADFKTIEITVSSDCSILYNLNKADYDFERYIDCSGHTADLNGPVNHIYFTKIKDFNITDTGNLTYELEIESTKTKTFNKKYKLNRYIYSLN